MKECSKCQRCYDDESNFCPHDKTPLISTISGDVIISGRYILEERLGKGGMGIVFKAKHKFLKSLYAIKLILPSLVEADNNLLVRFKQEAILAASINHPNVIRVTDFGVENERMPYLVMEFVDGTPLSHFFLQDKGLPVESAYELFQPIALGVAEAHRKGIVHRDLKPQNIMVEKELPLHKAVKVLDFGLAKIKSVESFGSLVQAQTMNIMGSPQYMSPEQWEDSEVDNRTDIYALGVILFQMLTGQLPFQADTIPSVMYQHLTALPPAFASLGVNIPPKIEAVVRKTLEKDREARHDTVEDLLNDFEQALAGSGIGVTIRNYSPPSSKKINAQTTANTANLTDSQQEKLLTYFDASATQSLLADQQLAQEFLEAQGRAEEAKEKVNQADRLVQEFAEAQKVAEESQQKALEARKKIEADVRLRVEAEMESKFAEQQARQKAEAERLAQEAEARKKAEDRANYLAQAALEAQKIAEAERKKSEHASHQRELEESVRRQAEIAASKLSEQVAEAKRKYEEAKNQAEHEAELRRIAELKRQKIESELQAAAEKEAERHNLAEAEAQKQIQEQAHRFEKEALAAQKRIEEARRLAEMEAQKREQAELAQQHAEEEARRLAQEIIEVQKRMDEFKLHTSSGTSDQTLNLLNFQSSGQHSASDNSSSSLKESAAQTSEFKDKTAPIIINVRGQMASTHQSGLESSQVTIESQVPLSSNPSFPSFLDASQTAPRKRSIPLIAAGSFVILFTFLVGGFIVYSFIPKSEKPEIPVQNPTNNSNTESNTAKTPPESEMILIKGGSFQMGRNDVSKIDAYYGDQFPAHSEEVKDFFISKTETTNGEYAEFIKERNHPAPPNWANGKVLEGQGKMPVTNVSLVDANAYADWFSQRKNQICRLPTEKEWEYVARNGSKATDFPWGNDWNQNFANLDTGKIAEVGTYPEATLDGVKDMLGNVNEWTSTKYTLYKSEGREKPNAEKEERIVTRGHIFEMNDLYLKKPQWLITYRYHYAMPEEKSSYLGFRLVCEK